MLANPNGQSCDECGDVRSLGFRFDQKTGLKQAEGDEKMFKTRQKEKERGISLKSGFFDVSVFG